MMNGKNLTAAFETGACRIGTRKISGPLKISALTIAAVVALTMVGILAAARADMTSPQPDTAVGAKPQLTFPPSSDCTFLGGSAGQACEKRRAGNAEEFQRVRNGEIKLTPPAVSSSGGPYPPLSNSGGLSGLGESAPLGPSENVAPTRSQPFNPNSIGNPWSGTPYSNGTGTHSY